MREDLKKIKTELCILEYWFSAVYHNEEQVKRIQRLEKICDDASVDAIEQSLCGGFKKELEKLINKYSKENKSNTPDFILASYLLSCLDNFDITMQKRRIWKGGIK